MAIWSKSYFTVIKKIKCYNIQYHAAAAAAKSLQSCPTLCDSIDGSLSGSAVPGILQARTLERVAISFSNARKWKVKVKPLSHVQVFAIPWTAAYQATPSMRFSSQEYWSGVPSPSPTTSWVNPKHNFESKKLDTKDATYCIILYKVQKLIKLSMLVEVG